MWIVVILIIALVIFLSTNKRYRWIYIIIKTIPRDIGREEQITGDVLTFGSGALESASGTAAVACAMKPISLGKVGSSQGASTSYAVTSKPNVKTPKRKIAAPRIRGIRLLIALNRCARRCVRENLTVSKTFSSVVEKYPQKIAFYFEDQAWTFEQADEFSSKIANYFHDNGYKRGDVVGLLLDNCIEYPFIWLGLSKIGVLTALINTNLVKDSIIHSITVTKCKSVIFGSALSQSIKDVSHDIASVKLYQLNENGHDSLLEGSTDLRKELESVSGKLPAERVYEASYDERALYIFTSGTTGLPKAAVLTHMRCILMANSARELARVALDDIFYTPLPLYHTAGGLMGAGQSIFSGTSVAIRKKFSATHYFEDCAKYNATVSQYVGELCRYLLTAPQNGPIKHQVRTIIGNGLRPQIWKPFVERYKIKNVVEIYGATEGISNLGNIDNTVGAIGFVPIYVRRIYPVVLIKCDEETGEAIRDSKGRCIKCGAEEAGMLIGKIDPNMPIFRFDGYSDRQSNEKKILTNVFREGDMYFNSGDILVYDEFGYFYFKDRTGDTFRWKGENVSTSEIEAVIMNIVQLNDVVVYGVKIPESEGNAGMAAIVDTNNTLDIDSICNEFRKNLPSYAIPIFIRVMDNVPMTATFKLKKTELRAEAYNIDTIKDRIYLLHPHSKKYVILTKDLYEELLSGKLRF